MKKCILGCAILSAVCITLALCSGCSFSAFKADIATELKNNKPAILTGEATGVAAASKAAFEKWAQSNPQAAHEAATAVLAVIPTATSVVQGNQIQVSTAVGALLNTQLFASSGVDPTIAAMITAASGALNNYASIPPAQLSQDAKDYIGAFLAGLQTGLTAFNAEPIPVQTPPPTSQTPPPSSAVGVVSPAEQATLRDYGIVFAR